MLFLQQPPLIGYWGSLGILVSHSLPQQLCHWVEVSWWGKHANEFQCSHWIFSLMNSLFRSCKGSPWYPCSQVSSLGKSSLTPEPLLQSFIIWNTLGKVSLQVRLLSNKQQWFWEKAIKKKKKEDTNSLIANYRICLSTDSQGKGRIKRPTHINVDAWPQNYPSRVV